MGIVMKFHVPTSLSAEAEARASSVMCWQPFDSASCAISSQRRGGMPRSRHVLTVDADNPSADATAPVPPRSVIALFEVSRMESNIVRDLRTGQGFATCETTSFTKNVPIPPMAETVKDIAKRLVQTREALGFPNQVDFCAAIDVAKNVYNPFEKGRRRISVDIALKIRRKFSIPLDWIYCGDSSQLPAKLDRKINRTAA